MLEFFSHCKEPLSMSFRMVDPPFVTIPNTLIGVSLGLGGQSILWKTLHKVQSPTVIT